MSRTKQKWCSFAIAILLPFSQKRKRQEKGSCDNNRGGEKNGIDGNTLL